MLYVLVWLVLVVMESGMIGVFLLGSKWDNFCLLRRKLFWEFKGCWFSRFDFEVVIEFWLVYEFLDGVFWYVLLNVCSVVGLLVGMCFELLSIILRYVE